jgi:hypothetical protein
VMGVEVVGRGGPTDPDASAVPMTYLPTAVDWGQSGLLSARSRYARLRVPARTSPAPAAIPR